MPCRQLRLSSGREHTVGLPGGFRFFFGGGGVGYIYGWVGGGIPLKIIIYIKRDNIFFGGGLYLGVIVELHYSYSSVTVNSAATVTVEVQSNYLRTSLYHKSTFCH